MELAHVSAGTPLGGPISLVAIGASTGGPPAIECVLRGLPRGLGAPVVIVNHMPPGFTTTWAERLNATCKLRVHEAHDSIALQPGHAYVAPAGLQVRIKRGANGDCRARLVPDFSDSLHVPSIDMLMSSAAEACGSRTLAILLTGIGTDGALGMLAVRRAGGYTIAQDEASSAAWGMPGSAVELGAAVEVLGLDHIAMRVGHLVERGSKPG